MKQHDAMTRAAAQLLVDDMGVQFRAGRRKPHIVIPRYKGLSIDQMIVGARFNFWIRRRAASKSGHEAQATTPDRT
ncbi:MAG: hypothetical protein V4636_19995 [Pseudomonadota bacterium]